MMFRATRCRVGGWYILCIAKGWGPGNRGCMGACMYIYAGYMEGCARACGCGIHGDLVTQHDANWIFKAFI